MTSARATTGHKNAATEAAISEAMAVVDPDILSTLCGLVESDRTTRALLESCLPASVRNTKRFVELPRR